MADADKTTGDKKKNFGIGIPQETPGFFLKGSAHLDWGMKHRLARIFNPKSGRTVMLAFDHGYIMGPTSGIERIDLAIPPLIDYVDCLMCTRGALRTCIPPETNKPVVLRCSTGATVLRELSDEVIGVTVEDAVRMNAAAVTTQVCIGAVHERETLENLSYLINEGNNYGVPTLGVTAVGKELVRDARYLGLACRVIAELGAHFVKTYYCEPDFEEVVAGCPVPIVIAGGKKLPEKEALDMAYKAINQGAAGVDMGRNIFCADDPVAMVQAVRQVVHENDTPDQAFDLYETLKREHAK
ncbi:MAG TPA: 3-hydroxy-5-phosphonooxypentane-2,4-dione thiolase [Candidatus Hydrogenedentes bacterium]|jgi:putative autoinducer-2 (AI-2) aldolase|nr:3-hydroxy-5-phosphonooxypentane-2,4-dione thiolase [Candidatus Hydrogenedentota bacterium]HPJ99905.1 3-hydroxy-5-phosphonooxypentane-2,4-dione thiolase [Candidatus Hydrogenedentota bacterium]